jgi:hypothetical protein
LHFRSGNIFKNHYCQVKSGIRAATYNAGTGLFTFIDFVMKLLLIFLLIHSTAIGQIIGTALPREIKKTEKYLFYLHGAVVTGRGNNVINEGAPEWGPYEYLNILDSLQRRHFNVISEIRQKGVEDSLYAIKIALQIDTLLRAGVKSSNIVIVGASAGSDIVLQVSSRLKNDALNFVIMGGCWPDSYKDYLNIELYGRFLSIIEKTDPHGTCHAIFEGRRYLKSFEEISLNTGLSHGLLYKGYKAWIDPIMSWLHEQ